MSMSASNGTEARFGWVPTPDDRGTIDIIWGCMLTTFLCVWTVLTLNVPARGTTLWAFTRTKMKWATIALFAPEGITIMAGTQWAIARQAKKQFQDGGVEWTMRQSFFADMGGVRVKLEDDEFPVTSKHIYILFNLGLIKLDAMSSAAIEDRSKDDGVAKLFAIVQTVWFILQCLARLVQNISITTLELSTIAFVVCTVGTNIMWWAKPKDVLVPVVLEIDCPLEDLLEIAGPPILDAKSEAVDWKWSPLEKFDDLRPNFLVDFGQYLPRTSSFKLSQPAQKVRFRNDRLPPPQRNWPLLNFLCVLSVAFGAVYVAGWNISFPTHAEQLIWRICTVTLLSSLGVFWLLDFGGELWRMRKKKKVPEYSSAAVTPAIMAYDTVIVVFYVTMRIYTLIEPFVCLRSLPAAAFKTIQWSCFIPHIH